MSDRRIAAVITDILGDRVIIGEDELNLHARKHFPNVPKDIVLEFLERILKDPVIIFEEINIHLFHLFYRIDENRYVVAVIKRGKKGSFFTSIYPTGKTMRGKHKRFKRIII